MNRDFFLDSGLQFESSSQSQMKFLNSMTVMPGIEPICSVDRISRPIWEKSERIFPQFDAPVSHDIGKLGGETLNSLSPAAVAPPNPFSTTNIPLSLPIVRNSMSVNPNLPLLTEDPAFAARAAKFSCFGSRSFNGRTNQLGLISGVPEIRIGSDVGKLPRVSSSPAVRLEENRVADEINVKLSGLGGSGANSNEESSVSEQIPSGEFGFKNKKCMNLRKRKGGSLKGVGSDTKNTEKEEEAIDESKRLKKTEEENGDKKEENTKPPEPPKDYIHVRARRGQATDSHSLAERVRREKISERMKLLQNLVPNCNKVTGKALMLDEIINYVQSLQRQVEFLSMKLATVNPSLQFDTNTLIPQNVNQPNGDLHRQTPASYPQNPQVVLDQSVPMTRPVHEFIEPFPHIQGFGQDDLQSIVGMGFGENLDFDTSFFQSIHDMKTEV